jgi:hypothetical protein
VVARYLGASANGPSTSSPASFTVRKETGLAVAVETSCAGFLGDTWTCWGAQTQGPPADAKLFGVALGSSHGCGLGPYDLVLCWGANESGQASPPPASFKSVAVPLQNAPYSCGIKTDGTAACWGSSLYGRTNPPTGQFTALTLGSQGACGLRPDATVSCWGNVPDAAVFASKQWRSITLANDRACGALTNGSLLCPGAAMVLPTGGNYTSIGMGKTLSCGLAADKTVNCWAARGYTATPPTGQFNSIQVGTSHACGVRTDGKTVVCWGDNGKGQATVPAKFS